MKVKLFACVLSAAFACGTHAAVMDLSPVADATIYGDATSNANGKGAGIFAGNNANQVSATRRGLLRFDVSSLPDGAVVSSVSLRLYCDQENTQKGPLSVTLHRVITGWTEGPAVGSGGGAGAGNGDTTWEFASLPGSAWLTPGGDFVAEDSALTPVGAERTFYNWSGSGLVADVQAWADESAGNFGWIIRSDETEVRTAKRFVSREGAVVDQRPVLTVEYALIPEPSTLGLVALAGLALRRRK